MGTTGDGTLEPVLVRPPRVIMFCVFPFWRSWSITVGNIFFLKFLLVSFLLWMGYGKRDFDVCDIVSEETEAFVATWCKVLSVLWTFEIHLHRICICISMILEKNSHFKRTANNNIKKEIHPKATFATLLQKLFSFFFHCMVLKYPGFRFAVHLSCYCLNALPRHHGPYGPYLECFPWPIKDWPWSLSFPGIYHLLSYSYHLSVFFLIKILSYRYFI